MHTLLLLSILAALLFTPGVTLAQSASLMLSPDRAQVNLNNMVSVSVTLNSPEPLTSLYASVLYDASRLTLVRIEENKTQFPYWWGNGFRPATPATGEARLQASASPPGVQGENIPIATLHFQGKGNGLAALLVSQESLALTANDTNMLDSASPSGAIFTVGSILPVGPALASFPRNLQQGDQGTDVRALQQLLNARGFPLASDGPGSPGQETEYFGPATQAALIRFQESYASQILHPVGLTTGTGYFGPSTRAYITNL